jgi:hypothetical protein
MENRIDIIARCLVAAAMCMLQLCTSGPTGHAGGSSSETVIGVVASESGAPVDGAEVTLRRSDYLADTTLGLPKMSVSRKETVTDADGSFRIDSVDPGAYCIEVNDLQSSAVLIKTDVAEGAGLVDLDTQILAPYASVSGSVDTALLRGAKAFVQVYGLERLMEVGPDGRFTVNNLPEGEYRFRIVANDPGVVPIEIDTVRALSGDTVPVFAGWSYSKRLYLNTTATGAEVADDVFGFPLLVRLDSSTFPLPSTFFSQARDSGQDIRFSKPGGTMLPYEIERWDSAAQSAALWVRLDTVHGNSESQAVVIHWGNPEASDQSDGAAVFDTADGFAGAWHMEADASDATVCRNDGTPHGVSAVPGMIGDALAFDGLSGYVEIPVSPSLDLFNSSLTITAWVKTPGNGNTEQIIYEHDIWGSAGQYQLTSHADSVFSSEWGGVLDDNGYAEAVVPELCNDTWHLLTITFSNALDSLKLYYDGEQVIAQTDTSYPGSSVAPSYIGSRQGTGRFFKGSIDELRVMLSYRSAGWIKLCYENQKENSTLVQFR